MLQERHMELVSPKSWIPDQESEQRDDIVLTAAELAECTCPDPCERDHDFGSAGEH